MTKYFVNAALKRAKRLMSESRSSNALDGIQLTRRCCAAFLWNVKNAGTALISPCLAFVLPYDYFFDRSPQVLEESVVLPSGCRLGSYEIIGPLGAGGMGEVYRAHDSKLKRQVAIKILPTHVASDPERTARFIREAQVLASLNHSSIGAIYDLQETQCQHYLVLELAEGETLAERIGRRPIATDDAIAIAEQIAAALEAAHGKGIIHRDLKPANIKITPQGTVKVLDFGLAMLVEGEQSALPAEPLSTSPTASAGHTVRIKKTARPFDRAS